MIKKLCKSNVKIESERISRKKRKKSLIDSTIINILYTIGISDRPLSSQQIINKMKELELIPKNKQEKRVHDKLRLLTPFEYQFEKKNYLFDWNKFMESNETYDEIILKRFRRLIKKKLKEKNMVCENNDIYEIDADLKKR